MNSNLKYAVPGALLVVAVVLIMLSGVKPATAPVVDTTVQPSSSGDAASQPVIRATGNVDDMTAALYQDSAIEQTIIESDMEAASSILSADQPELVELGQSYNGNEF